MNLINLVGLRAVESKIYHRSGFCRAKSASQSESLFSLAVRRVRDLSFY
jgi:hypothetical protein